MDSNNKKESLGENWHNEKGMGRNQEARASSIGELNSSVAPIRVMRQTLKGRKCFRVVVIRPHVQHTRGM